MLKIHIQGLRDGLYDVDLSVPALQIPGLFEEFVGNVEFKGRLRIIGKRFAVTGVAECDAVLNCDISLAEFNEKIKADISCSFYAADKILFLKNGIDKKPEEYIIHEDEKYLDITQEVCEELAVNLPMKRIAPEFRGMSFEEIYPQFSKSNLNRQDNSSGNLDPRWAPLAILKRTKDEKKRKSK